MNQIIQHKNKWYIQSETGYREIIASTYLNLRIPQIPQSFISLYIEEYNKRNIIEEVDVKYKKKWDTFIDGDITDSTFVYVPKINNDNTISIKLLRNSWNREELEEAAENYIIEKTKPDNIDFKDHFINFSGGSFEKDCWISGAKSETAKQYWQQGMYSEKEVEGLLDEAVCAFQNISRNRSSWSFDVRDWFKQNKKK